MPETGDRPNPPKPVRTWWPMILWTAGILLAMGLAWFVGAVAWPVYKVRKAVPMGTTPVYYGEDSFLSEIGVDWTGSVPVGCEDVYWWPNAADVELYLHMPDAIAPGKVRATSLLEAMENGVPVLARLLGNSRADLRMAGACFLATDDPRARQAVPALVRALRDEHYAVRCLSARALGRIGSPESIEALTAAQHDEVEDVRKAAAAALKKIREQVPAGR